MKHPFLLISISILLIFSCQNKKETPSTSTPLPKEAAQLDEYFTALANLKKFNGAVLVHKDEKPFFKKAFNMNVDEPASLKITTESQFDIHSISKIMAKAIIVKLEQDGKMKRSDFLEQHVTGFPNGHQITIQHLLTNQSGLPRELTSVEENIELSPEEFVNLAKKEKIEFTPGTDTRYSNVGFQLVYFVIASIVEKPFVQYLKEDIFEPLGMKESGAHFFVDKSNLKRLAANHELEDDGSISKVPNVTTEDKKQAKIFSTLEDMNRYLNYVGKEPFASALEKKGTIGWSGGGDGIRTHATINIKENYTFVFFSNFDEIPFNTILKDVPSIMEGKPYEVPKELNRQHVKVSTDIMDKYVGKYDLAEWEHKELEFRVEKDSLVFYEEDVRNTALFTENDSTFFYDKKLSDSFIFTEAENGEYNVIFKWKGVEFIGLKK